MNRLRVLQTHIFPRFTAVASTLSSHIETSSSATASSRNELKFKFSDEVTAAKRANKPIVALESTIVSHGMPYPQNVQTAREVEAIIRAQGAVPATIAILDGVICVGLSPADLEKLGKLGTQVMKVSRRDLAYVVSQRAHGATTVAATMMIAHMVGIRVFVTGGIGGVHRGGEVSMDVSADLTELAQTPVAVVCAGVKSLLDIPRTLEYLETQGVGVITYRSKEFPAFFTPHSGCESPLSASSTGDIAAMLDASARLGLQSSVVVAVPIREADAADAATAEQAIQTALREADEKHVRGKEITPFLLKRVNELTKGASLKANIALIKHNAEIGAQIASQLNDMLLSTSRPSTTATAAPSAKVTVVGGAVTDVMCTPADELLVGTSNPGHIEHRFGGVGRNIAEALARFGSPPCFISAVGRDAPGEALISSLQSLGINADSVLRTSECRTAVFNAVLERTGALHTAVADMGIFDCITTEWIQAQQARIAESRMVIIDANAPVTAILFVCRICHERNIEVLYEPVSVPKCTRIIEAGALPYISHIKPNYDEAVTLAKRLGVMLPKAAHDKDVNVATACAKALLLFGAKLRVVLVSLGAAGVLVATRDSRSKVQVNVLAAPRVSRIVNTNGAGDSLCAGFVWWMCCKAERSAESDDGRTFEMRVQQAVEFGLSAAKLTLESELSVSPLLGSLVGINNP